MKKFRVILVVALALCMTEFALAQKDYFNELGEVPTNLPTSYDKNDMAPIQFLNPRADDIMWNKVVYRLIDLREKMNYPLYFPEDAGDGRQSLFTLIFNLVKENKVPAFRFESAREVFKKESTIDFEEFLKTFGVIYKVKKDPITNQKVYDVDESDIPNRECLKYYLKEVWFFDKHSSTFNVKIIAISPVLVMDRNDGSGLMSYNTFWVPFDALRPYLAQTEVLITDKNNGARMSFDDLFIKRRFSGNVYKESNIQNRTLLDYSNTSDEIKKEQARIKNEILNFEQDLWEY